MSDLLKRTAVLALVVGLLIGFFAGLTVDTRFNGQAVENKKDNEESGLSNYEIIGFQFEERVKAYYGLVDSVEQSADISENDNPETVSRKIREWLGEQAACRHYATLTFTVLADRWFENLALHVGYVKLDNQKRGHVWLKWENQSLEYPKTLRFLKHISENIYTKKQLWDGINN